MLRIGSPNSRIQLSSNITKTFPNGVPPNLEGDPSMRSLMLRPCTSLSVIAFLVVLAFISLWQSSTLTEWQTTLPSSSSSSPSSYRASLSALRPTGAELQKNQRTLGIASKIYVLNLAKRQDRRLGMEQLARAMDLDFTFFNGTDLSEQEGEHNMRRILEHIRQWRSLHRVNKDAPNEDPENFEFTWAADVGRGDALGNLRGAELWTLDGLIAPSPDTRPPVLDTYDENGKTWGGHPLKLAQLACWHSHYRLLRTIADGEDDVAIVFEDDIDMEWDLSYRLSAMWPALNDTNWDIVMLGHCHSQEWHHPPLRGSPFLHPSKHVLCTHAYAVTRTGARKMVRYLRSEAFAYSRTVDHAFQHLQSRGKVKSFSVYPPVVVQTYDMGSDIIPGRTNKDRVQWLQDSALERIELGKQLGM